MSDLLKEAIADAKAVRETALANAKMALEEAFTPHLKSMLSAKLSEEDLEEDEDVFEGEHEEEDDEDDEEKSERKHAMGREDDDDDPEEGMHGGDSDPEGDDEEEVDESEIVEIDGVKYAPIVSVKDTDSKNSFNSSNNCVFSSLPSVFKASPSNVTSPSGIGIELYLLLIIPNNSFARA